MVDQLQAELHVELVGVSPSTWRLLRIPLATSLLTLHEVLQIAMGWEAYHLFRYEVGNDVYGRVDLDIGVKDSSIVTIADIVSARYQEFFYIYDLLGGWRHRVSIRRVCAADCSGRYSLVGGEQQCPRDDGSGPVRYMRKGTKGKCLEAKCLVKLQAEVAALVPMVSPVDVVSSGAS